MGFLELCFSGLSAADPHQHAPWLLMNPCSELKRDTSNIIRQNAPKTSWFSVKLWDVYLNKTQLGFIAKGVRGKRINYMVDMYDYLLFGLLSASLSTSLYSCAVKTSLGSLFSFRVRYMPLYGVKQGKVKHAWYVSPVVQSWSTWELHGVFMAWHEGGFHLH